MFFFLFFARGTNFQLVGHFSASSHFRSSTIIMVPSLGTEVPCGFLRERWSPLCCINQTLLTDGVFDGRFLWLWHGCAPPAIFLKCCPAAFTVQSSIYSNVICLLNEVIFVPGKHSLPSFHFTWSAIEQQGSSKIAPMFSLFFVASSLQTHTHIHSWVCTYAYPCIQTSTPIYIYLIIDMREH